MNGALDDDGRSTTRLIFSLSVTSPTPIVEFLDIPSLRRGPRSHRFGYDFGMASAVNAVWGVRARTLDALVDDALDRLDATGIDPAELAIDSRVVEARFSVSPGTEVLSSDVVRRLARVHARIQMDSWG
jgi:hypothetical protein